MSSEISGAIKVLAFDVFGTVVDWQCIAREIGLMNLNVDGDEFAPAWRAGYKSAMPRGDACQAFTAHGFVRREKAVMMAIGDWIATRKVAALVGGDK